MASAISTFQNQVESFADDHLRPYLDRIEASVDRLQHSQETKEFNDPVWKTISLFPFEVLIVDCPLLQRLRQIRQLGVVHWVFQSAHHTRFEHTIGVLHQTQQLATSLNAHRLPPSPEDPLPDTWVKLLRLAALSHDVGHGFMSHVSENALASSEEVGDLLVEITRGLGTLRISKKPKLAEAISYYMVGSDEYRRMLKLAKQLCPEHRLPYEDPHDVQKAIQRTIVGAKLSDEYPILHELITGPFDADKLDYMSRDSTLAGVPRVTDIARLVEKARMVKLNLKELPQRLADITPTETKHCWIQGISISAAKTLDELLIGRTLLYDKVYRHQKVRELETFIASFVAVLCNALPAEFHALLPLNLTDDQFASFSLGHLPIRNDERGKYAIDVAQKIARRIVERRLPVRAYAFPPHASMPDGSPHLAAAAKDILEILRKPSTAAILVAEVVQCTKLIVKKLKATGYEYPEYVDIEEIPLLEHTVGISASDIQEEATDVGNAYLVLPGPRLEEFQVKYEQAKPWSNAYISTRDFTYLFAPEELAAEVFLATEVVQVKRKGVAFANALQGTKIPKVLINDLRQRLTTAEFYEGAMRELRSVPENMQTEGYERRTIKAVKTLGLFEGVSDDTSQRKSSIVSDDAALRWLRQFDLKANFTEEALQLIERTRVIRRDDVVAALEECVAETGTTRVCPLGGDNDSSSIVRYYVGDLAGRLDIAVSDVPASLASGDRILFLDDFIGSGKQSVTILKQLLGEVDEEALEESHVEALSPDNKPLFEASKLVFLFVAGQEAGKKYLLEYCNKRGLEASVTTHIAENDLPRAFEAGKESAEFRSFCEEVGKQLLVTSSKLAGRDRTQEWVDERCLGYGNQGFLLAFPYNVPSQTLTLIWSAGDYAGRPWHPLMPRRKKA